MNKGFKPLVHKVLLFSLLFLTSLLPFFLTDVNAMTVSISSGGNSSGGLVGHWQLNEESENVGSDLVINGGFGSDSDWTKQTGWAISGGTANATASVDRLLQSPAPLTIGKKYFTSYTISNYSSGSVRIEVGGNDVAEAGITRSANGTYTEILTCVTSTNLDFDGMTAFTGSIDNVTIKEIHAADSTVNNNDGTIYGATYTVDRRGQTNKALAFDGTDDYINADSAASNISPTSGTVTMWAKADASGGFAFHSNANIRTYISRSSPYFLLSKGNPSVNIPLPNTAYGEWAHIVLTWNNGTMKGYQNGVLIDTKSFLNTTAATVMRIGHHSAAQSTDFFDGSISDVRTYDRALSFSEIKGIYEGRNQTTSSGNTKKGLVGHWPLTSEGEKVGNELFSIGDMESDPAASFEVNGTGTISNETGSGNYHSGNQSLKLVGNADTGVHYAIQYVTVTPGKKYRFRGWLKSATDTNNEVSYAIYDHSNSVWIRPRTQENLPEWTQRTYEFIAPEGCTIVRLYVSTTTIANATGYFDDYSVKEIHTADTTGHANHGTIYGADVRNHGYSFDGTDDVIDIADNSDLKGFSAISISAWIKPNATHTGGIIDKNRGLEWNTHLADSKVRFEAANTSSSAIRFTANTALSNDAWTHVIITYDGSTGRSIYYNGVSQSITVDDANTGSIDSGTNAIKIGAMSDGYNLNGSLADIRVYDRALSATEALNLYHGADIASPVGHWPLSSGAGDISGNGNAGTVSGATIVGESATFDGVDDYVDTGTDMIGTGDVTVAGWIYPTSWGESGDNGGIGRVFDNGKTMLYVREDGPNSLVFSSNGETGTTSATNSIELNKWQFVTVTRTSAGIANFYIGDVNTAPALSGTADQSSGTPVAGTSNVIIGNRSAQDRTFDGQISDLRVFNRILSTTEITSLYTEGHSESKQAVVGSLNKGLVGHWPLTTEGEKVGTDLFSGWDFTSGWTATGTAAIVDSDTFTMGAGAGGMLNFNEVVTGKKYRATISGDTTITSLYLRDSEHPEYYSPLLSNTFNETFDFVATNSHIYFFAQTAGTTNITSFVIKELHTADTTPQSNHGTIYGADIRNHGYEFDGMDDVIDAGTLSEFNLTNAQDFTLSAWFKPDTVSGYHLIAGKSFNEFRLIQGESALLIQLDSGDPIVTASSVLSVGTWYHGVLTYDASTSTAELFLDGISKGSDSATSPSWTSGTNFRIGHSPAGDNYPFDGNIADVQLYDRVLSDTEILDLYNGADIASPVGHWPLSTGAGDISGNGNAGTVTGASLVGNVASFDGVDDYVDVGSDSNLDVTDAITIGAWVKFDTVSVAQTIFIRGDWTSDGYYFDFDAGRLNIRTNQSGEVQLSRSSTAPFVINQWYYIVGTVNGSVGKIYINGVEDTNIAGTHINPTTSTNSAYIGRYGVGAQPFNGQIADVRIYDRALSLKEIQMLYEQGR